MDEQLLLNAIRQRTVALFERVAAGDDATPGWVLRLEGMREAAVLSGAATEDELQAGMAAIFQTVFGAEVTQRLGPDWQERHPFPELPLFMDRAPVSPGTGD